MMTSVVDELYPKKILGSAVKITIGITIKTMRIMSSIFTRNGTVSLTAAAAAPYRPDTAAA